MWSTALQWYKRSRGFVQPLSSTRLCWTWWTTYFNWPGIFTRYGLDLPLHISGLTSSTPQLKLRRGFGKIQRSPQQCALWWWCTGLYFQAVSALSLLRDRGSQPKAQLLLYIPWELWYQKSEDYCQRIWTAARVRELYAQCPLSCWNGPALFWFPGRHWQLGERTTYSQKCSKYPDFNYLLTSENSAHINRHRIEAPSRTSHF
jgi:hypothetical protein